MEEEEEEQGGGEDGGHWELWLGTADWELWEEKKIKKYISTILKLNHNMYNKNLQLVYLSLIRPLRPKLNPGVGHGHLSTKWKLQIII